MDYHLERGQVYRSCTPGAAPARYVRILVGGPGRQHVTIVDAATGRRERNINAGQLHPYPADPAGHRHRRGYAHIETHEWVDHLVDEAVRGHASTIASTAIAQDPWRGGFVLLRPKVTLSAVRAVVTALEAADWTVETATTAHDELRVRLRGQLTCPAMHSSSSSRWYCDLPRGHRDRHQDSERLESWNDDTPQPPAWWLPGQLLPDHVPADA
ncbi:hypothetical protein [Streptomyces sp. NPDC056672]|uniref:hypothetical protein n=1 Tax=Streptomyces sp. NPDC056672 TaxID=3345906 RepID=UPI0036B30FA1